MDAKSRAWQRLQAELQGAKESPAAQKMTIPLDSRKETLLSRIQRLADASLAKQDPEPEAA